MRPVSLLLSLLLCLSSCSGEKKGSKETPPPQVSDAAMTEADTKADTSASNDQTQAPVDKSPRQDALTRPDPDTRLSRSVRAALGDTGLYVFARLPIRTPMLRDEKRVFLHFGDSRGINLSQGPLAERKLNWRKTMSSLRFAFEPIPSAADPDGPSAKANDKDPAKGTTTKAGTITLETERGAGATVPLSNSATATLVFAGKALMGRTHRGGVSARLKRGAFPNQSGRYKMRISGKVFLDKEEILFVLPPLDVEYLAPGPEVKSVRELEKIARTHLRTKLGKVSIQREKNLLATDTESGWRVFAFKSPIKRGPGWVYWRNLVVVDKDGTLKRIDRHRVSTCIGEGVLIDSPSGARAIQELDVGDVIWGFDHQRGQRVPVVVESRIRHDASETVTLKEDLHVSATHPVLTRHGFQWAMDARSIRTSNGWRSVTPAAGPRMAVYDLSVSWPHTFIASGAVVHNKTGAYVPSMFDAWRLNPPRHDAPPEESPGPLGSP